MQIDAADIEALRELKSLTRRPRDRQKISDVEGRLSPAAGQWWLTRSRDDINRELKRWVPAHQIEKGEEGWKAFKWDSAKGRYATRATRTGLTEEEAKALTVLSRVG